MLITHVASVTPCGTGADATAKNCCQALVSAGNALPAISVDCPVMEPAVCHDSSVPVPP